MKTNKISTPEIGTWYKDNFANHAYLITGTLFDKKGELKKIKCAYFLDLQNSGEVRLDPFDFQKLKKLEDNDIVYLDPLDDKKKRSEIRNVFQSIKNRIAK